MQFPEQGKQPPAVIVDTGLTRIDDVLALALLFGFAGRREVREGSISVSRYDLKAAQFCDAMRRFYAGNTGGGTLPLGISTGGKTSETPMILPALAKVKSGGEPVYPTAVRKFTDTASGPLVIRNSLTAQQDQNAIVALAGPATNLVKLIDLPGGRDLVIRTVRFLALSAPRQNMSMDLVSARRLFAEWPTPVVVAGQEIGEAILYPASSIEKDFNWSQDNPLVDAYRAYQPMPYDAPTWDMTAVLHAVRPNEGYFDLSPPGTIVVQEDGRTKFTPASGGRHRCLILKPDQKERVQKLYIEIASARPTARQRFSTLPQKKEGQEQKKN